MSGGEQPHRLPIPVFQGESCFLRPVLEQDVIPLYHVAMIVGIRWPRVARWSHRSPGQFSDYFWAGLLAGFIVEDTNHRPIGFVACYDADFASEHAWVEAVAFPPEGDTASVLTPDVGEAVSMLLRYAFETWSFRKLYARYFDIGESPVALIDYAVEEGRLREHTLWEGWRWDQLIVVINHSDWAPRQK